MPALQVVSVPDEDPLFADLDEGQCYCDGTRLYVRKSEYADFMHTYGEDNGMTPAKLDS